MKVKFILNFLCLPFGAHTTQPELKLSKPVELGASVCSMSQLKADPTGASVGRSLGAKAQLIGAKRRENFGGLISQPS